MKANIITDIKTAVKMFTEIRKARKEGAAVEVRQCQQLPFIRCGGFYNTVEGLTLAYLDRKIVDSSQEAFNGLSEDVKNLLYFSPKDGEFTDRANFWRYLLEPVLTAEELRAAMICILRWYIHIKHMHLGMDVPEYGPKGVRA